MVDESGSDGPDGTNLKRRSVLKSAAAGVAATGMAGAASARSRRRPLSKEEIEAITAEYRSADLVREAFEAQPAVLEAAADAGYLESASVDALDVELDFESYEAAGREGDMALFNAKLVDGEPAPAFRVVREFEDGALTLASNPTEGTGYAVFARDDGVEELYRSAPGSDDAPRATACDECLAGAGCASNEECQTQLNSCCCDPACPNISCVVYKCVCVENCGGGGWI